MVNAAVYYALTRGGSRRSARVISEAPFVLWMFVLLLIVGIGMPATVYLTVSAAILAITAYCGYAENKQKREQELRMYEEYEKHTAEHNAAVERHHKRMGRVARMLS